MCRPYRRNWGQSPNSEILRTVPKFSLPLLRGSGGLSPPQQRSNRIRLTQVSCVGAHGCVPLHTSIKISLLFFKHFLKAALEYPFDLIQVNRASQ